MKLGEVLEKTIQFFKDKGFQTARLDSELLISSALGFERIQLYLKFDQPLKEEEMQRCRDLVRRRSSGEPVAYILGEKGFYGSNFFVSKGVLIPRPETEIIVDHALRWIEQRPNQEVQVADLGCGTGCIGISILLRSTNSLLTAFDLSEEAIKCTRRNTEQHNLIDRVKIFKTDLQDAIQISQINNTFDVIVANPPYISASDPLIDKHVKEFEPGSALFSDENGFKDIRLWAQSFIPKLNSGGIMLFEIGYNQGQQAKDLFEGFKIFSQVRLIKDLAGHDRVIEGVMNG